MNIKTVGIISMVVVGAFIGGFKTHEWLMGIYFKEELKKYPKNNNNSVIFQTRQDAETVLSTLTDLVLDYGEATIADLRGLGGQNSRFTDSKKGWKDLSGTTITRAYKNYSLNLPEPISLE